MHGCGNDYIYVDCTQMGLKDKKLFAQKYSDRHKGIGSDGLICIYPSKVADFRMRMYNADGSEGEMCGNGIRCVGKFVRDNRLTDKTKFTVETKAGIKTLEVLWEEGEVSCLKVDMGKADMTAENVPVVGFGDEVNNKKIEFADKTWNISCVNTGVPHCVVFVDKLTDELLNTYGPLFEKAPFFPKKANIDFIEVINENTIDMRVWERGSGETLACGTGACASAVASFVAGKTKNDVTVNLLGGELKISIDSDMNVWLIGPATTVYSGNVNWEMEDLNKKMQLNDVLKSTNYKLVRGNLNTNIEGIAYDSRKVVKNGMFVCISGTITDGHKYIDKAIENGANTIIVEKDVDAPLSVTIIKVKDSRKALATISKEWFENPTDKLKLIGVTGTKGKTTTTYMIKKILEEDGKKVGLIGTIETIIGDKRIPSNNTTPESYILQKQFREMVDAGIEYVVMEVSSQAFKMNRVYGIHFDYGVFTNLEEDHIGGNEHPTMDDYISCKSRLFQNCNIGIVNSDADYLDKILKNHTCSIRTYGLTDKSDIYGTNIERVLQKDEFGIKYTLNRKDINQTMNVYVDIPATFTVYNSLSAITTCLEIGVKEESIIKAMAKVKVKGRLEIVETPYDYMLMIDYAHNAMSLEAILKDVKQYNPNRIICMFGCGGNRSKVRRYEMGEVSSKLADLTVVTSDNPRDEEPMDIINDILIGVNKADGEYVTIPDRREAIKYCMKNGQPRDIVILAGKGHEDYQEIRGKKHHMDEREIISDILKNMA